MKLVILGATGGVGQQLVTTATSRGDDILIVARDKTRLPHNWTCNVAEIDLLKAPPTILESAIAGADAVLSALGARRARRPGNPRCSRHVGAGGHAGDRCAPLHRNQRSACGHNTITGATDTAPPRSRGRPTHPQRHDADR
jgi:NAD(P)H-binding